MFDQSRIDGPFRSLLPSHPFEFYFYIFDIFFLRCHLPNLPPKTDYHASRKTLNQPGS